MSKKMVEISMLKNYAPSNLNRDEGGNPKDCVFGGVLRGRISSQCIKRSIRKSAFFSDALGESLLGIRTVHMPSCVASILKNRGYTQELAEAAAEWLANTGKSKKNIEDSPEDDKDEGNKELRTAQIMFFSKEELEAIADEAAKMIEETGRDLKAIKKLKNAGDSIESELKKKGIKPVSVDMAMFGRMITSNAYKNVEASVQVAHAVSTNKLEREFDFFTAVDDVPQGDEMQQGGSGMLGDTGFNSNCYYMYCAIDLEELEKNLSALGEEAENIAKKAVVAFAKAFAYANPSGKQNSFAAHSLPGLVCVSIKDKKIPINLADAFLKPAMYGYGKDLMHDSAEKLINHIDKLDDKYSDTKPETRLWFTMNDDIKGPKYAEKCEKFDLLLERLRESI
ncbi:MAG: type I-E CRISPR-associated protein Cas7/Cse4/CasC [Bacillota bacterium]|nr:type I-E CRISPR-associated protein Cas7/Cse4/CasC [Bacillota bacterium]